MKDTSKSIGKKVVKVIILIFSSIIILFLLFIGALNLFKFGKYSEYYDSLTRLCKNPGLKDDFIPQGITYRNGFYYTTGYMKDGSASRIYKAHPQLGEIYVTLQSNGEDFVGHTGGLQYTDGSFYLANESLGVFIFDASLLLDARNEDVIEIGYPHKVNNNSSFVFSDDEFLYVGEFNNDKNYISDNKITYNDVTHRAIVSQYYPHDLTKPIAIYSIPNEIQGFCKTDDGRIVLSRSYSVSSSNFFIYEGKDIINTNTSYDNAPLFFLDEPTRNVEGPAMSEDLDYEDGKVITLFESACNKYYFGKLFGATYIAGLDFKSR